MSQGGGCDDDIAQKENRESIKPLGLSEQEINKKRCIGHYILGKLERIERNCVYTTQCIGFLNSNYLLSNSVKFQAKQFSFLFYYSILILNKNPIM
jgi:hypothetical protein